MLKGKLGLQFMAQGKSAVECPWGHSPPDMQMLGEIVGDRPSATAVYKDFVFLNTFPWEVSVICF